MDYPTDTQGQPAFMLGQRPQQPQARPLTGSGTTAWVVAPKDGTGAALAAAPTLGVSNLVIAVREAAGETGLYRRELELREALNGLMQQLGQLGVLRHPVVFSLQQNAEVAPPERTASPLATALAELHTALDHQGERLNQITTRVTELIGALDI